MRTGAALLVAAVFSTARLWPAELEVRLGVGNTLALNRWAPLVVECEGAPPGSVLEIGKADREGAGASLQLFDAARYPTLECPVRIGGVDETFVVRLRSDAGTLAERRIDASNRVFPGHILLAIDMPSGAPTAMEAALEPMEPARARSVGAADLPALALDLDAIAGIALGDASTPLSPAQLDALQSWLAAGGHLVVFGRAESPRNLAARLAGSGAAARPAPLGGSFTGIGLGGSFTGIGLGGIVSMDVDARDFPRVADPAFWREAFALESFGHDARIAAGRLPDTAGLLPDLESPLFLVQPAVLAWSLLWALSLALAARARKGPATMLLISTFFGALGIGAAASMPGIRQGLASGWTRAVALNDGSALVELGVARLVPEGWEPLADLAKGRGFEAYLAGDRAEIDAAGGLISLRHPGVPAVSPRDGAPGESEFLGWLPPSSVTAPTVDELAVRPSGNAFLFSVGSWSESSPEGWLLADGPPAFLGRDKTWALRLVAAYPMLDFVFVRSRDGLPSPSIAGGSDEEPLVAYPFAGRNQK